MGTHRGAGDGRPRIAEVVEETGASNGSKRRSKSNERGQTETRPGLKRYEQTFGVLLLISLVWLIAFWSYIRHLPAAEIRPIPLPETIDHQPPTIDARFVASTLDRTSKRYHLPDCSYVKLLKHGRGFSTEQEAMAAGYEPCSRCLGAKIARVR